MFKKMLFFVAMILLVPSCSVMAESAFTSKVISNSEIVEINPDYRPAYAACVGQVESMADLWRQTKGPVTEEEMLGSAAVCECSFEKFERDLDRYDDKKRAMLLEDLKRTYELYADTSFITASEIEQKLRSIGFRNSLNLGVMAPTMIYYIGFKCDNP